MPASETAMRNGPSGVIEDLTKEVATLRQELADAQRERDKYRRAVYALLEKHWNHELDPDDLRKAAIMAPPIEEYVNELFNQPRH